MKNRKQNQLTELTPKQEANFFKKVDEKEQHECWEWTGCKNDRGYGYFGVGKNNPPGLAHRLAVLLDGRNPNGKVVMHTCDNPSCVNPNHLTVGTQQDNIIDMYKKNRAGHLKFVPDDIRQIRSAMIGVTKTERIELIKHFTLQYGVSYSAIYAIVNGHTWKHI